MDSMFTLLWQQYRTWADTARHLKEQNARWKRNVLTLTVVAPRWQHWVHTPATHSSRASCP
jgi:hypothetical protein